MSRLEWHIGQPVTTASAPAAWASFRMSWQRSTTAPVMDMLNPQPQHSVA
jgi:hypothetical protein